MLLTAICASIAGIAYQHQSAKKAIQFWTPELAQRLGQSKQIRLAELQWVARNENAEQILTASGRTETVRIGDRNYRVTKSIPGDQVRGLVHLRRGLLFDRVLADNSVGPVQASRNWRFALEFGNGESTTANDLSGNPRQSQPLIAYFTQDGQYVACNITGKEMRLLAGERFAVVLSDALHRGVIDSKSE